MIYNNEIIIYYRWEFLTCDNHQ